MFRVLPGLVPTGWHEFIAKQTKGTNAQRYKGCNGLNIYEIHREVQ